MLHIAELEKKFRGKIGRNDHIPGIVPGALHIPNLHNNTGRQADLF